MIRLVTDAERLAFDRDGCVLLQGIVPPPTAQRLAAAADRELSGRPPGYHVRPSIHEWNADFHEFVWTSGIAKAAASLIGADRVRLYGGEIFAKDPGEREPIKWHNDISYYPFSDGGLVSIWVALGRVTKEMSALQVVPGSHKWTRMFKPHIPSSAGAVKEIVESADFEVPPDFAELAERYPGAVNILSWHMEPGDAVAFSGWTLHHTGANLSSAARRIGYSMRFIDRTVVYDPRPNTLTPPEYRDLLKPGARVDAGWPVVWQADGPVAPPPLLAQRPVNKYERLAQNRA